MSTSLTHVQPWVAQTPTQQQVGFRPNLWMMSSGILLIVLVGVSIFSSIQLEKIRKRLKFEEYKNRELQKKVKLALGTITKMERNPDLIHSREFNLDYLRMRMDEEKFNFAILNQLKVKVKQKVSVALRPQQASQGMVGIASKPRQVDEMFDVEYTTSEALGAKKRVLFRIQIKLAKLPTQTTSTTINQIIDCIETFLKPDSDTSNWQPTLQGRIAYMHWDQKAKPTPLLVLEQSRDGVNVTFRSTNRSVNPTDSHSINPTDSRDPNQVRQNTSQTARRPPTPTPNQNPNQVARPSVNHEPGQNPNQAARRPPTPAPSQNPNQTARRSVSQSTRRTANQAANQNANKASSRTANQAAKGSVSQSTSGTANQTASPKPNKSTSHNANQAARRDLKQAAKSSANHRPSRQ